MGARRVGVGFAIFIAFSCSDRPVPEVGSGMSGDLCVLDNDCVNGSVCFGEVCVQQGVFRVSLSWEVSSDFDLHVRTPSGAEVSFVVTNVAGGALDVDDCIDSDCNSSGTHVENIFFNSEADAGSYDVWVVNFNGDKSGSYTIEVAGAVEAGWSGELPASEGATSPEYSFDFDG